MGLEPPGFGLGGDPFQPDVAVDQIRARAQAFIANWRSLAGTIEQ